MEMPEVYSALYNKALYLVESDYTQDQIIDKIFDYVDSLYLDNLINEDLYNQFTYKNVLLVIDNARIALFV